jgi:hypothetical protein
MVDRIVIIKWNGYDTRNEPFPKTNVTTRGYVEWKTNLVRDLKGENVTAPIHVYLHMRKTDAALGRALCHEDRVIVDGLERPIIAIHEPKSFSCPHYEVYLAYGATRDAG